MVDLTKEIHILASVARVDAELNDCRKEIARLPRLISRIDGRLEQIKGTETEAAGSIEDMAKERRNLEQAVDDHLAQIVKYKTQLMQVKTNKEYTAMQHEIGHLEKEIDSKEERLLMLMDEAEHKGGENKELLSKTSEEKAKLESEKGQLEGRLAELNAQVARVEVDRPRLFSDLDPKIKKKYDRILAKYGDVAVTNIDDETCQGCFRRVPPQRCVEVRQADEIINCEGCGRILVHYDV